MSVALLMKDFILNTFIIIIVYNYDSEFTVLFFVGTSTVKVYQLKETKVVSELCFVNILFVVIHVCF